MESGHNQWEEVNKKEKGTAFVKEQTVLSSRRKSRSEREQNFLGTQYYFYEESRVVTEKDVTARFQGHSQR